MKINYILFVVFLTLIPLKSHSQALYDDIDSKSLKQLSLFACEALYKKITPEEIKEITEGMLHYLK